MIRFPHFFLMREQGLCHFDKGCIFNENRL